MIALLDANVLLALSWQTHVHHQAAHRWFAMHKQSGWATCAITEAAFVRLSANPSVVGTSISVADALRVLEASVKTGRHEFWPMTASLTRTHRAIRERLAGPGQITDALLLDLAIRRKGRLATFDRRTLTLLPPHSPDRSAIELIPA
ncbi:MAG: TA system VapC family ribonuclease toxin [Bryobacteraceae bacterium]